MQWLQRLQERHTWDRWLDLHQTEFERSGRNCMIIESCMAMLRAVFYRDPGSTERS